MKRNSDPHIALGKLLSVILLLVGLLLGLALLAQPQFVQGPILDEADARSILEAHIAVREAERVRDALTMKLRAKYAVGGECQMLHARAMWVCTPPPVADEPKEAQEKEEEKK
jgi:hypothetical protein